MNNKVRWGVLACVAMLATEARAAVLVVDCAAGPFTTISAAVAAASSGDTIVVSPCVYAENVVVAGLDDLHIVGARPPLAVGAGPAGVGALPSPPVIIDGTGLSGPCVELLGTSDVSIVGLTTRACPVGVRIVDAFDTVVAASRLQGHAFAAIHDERSHDSRIASNTIGLNGVGILVEGGCRTTIVDNRLGAHRHDGIVIRGDRVEVVHNEVTGSGGAGVRVVEGVENRVERNSLAGNNRAALAPANLTVEPGASLTDLVGNSTSGSIADGGAGTDVAANL